MEPKQLSKPYSSMGLIMFVLRIMGGFEPDRGSCWWILYKIYSYTFTFSLGFLFVLSQLINLFFIDDIIVLVDSSFLMIEQIAMLVKVCLIIANHDKVITLLETLKSPLFTSHSVNQDHFIQTSNKIVKRNSRMFFGCVTTCCSILGVTPFIMGTRQLPTAGYFPWSVTVSPNYEIIGAWQGLATLLTALFNAAIDLMSSGFMILACGQLNVLADNLETVRPRAILSLSKRKPIGPNFLHDQASSTRTVMNTIDLGRDTIPMKKTIPYDVLENQIYLEVVKCIQHHNAVLDFISLVNEVFTFGVLAQFAASVLVICLTAFEFTVIPFNDPKIMFVITYQCVMLAQIFLYCWYGNEVYCASLNVFDAAYMSAWQKSGKRVRQAIGMILVRSKKPVILKAGKLIHLTLDTFISILRLSYSVFALLQQASADDDVI